MIVSVSQAARLSGKSRQTLYDMRDNGKLSFTTDPDSGRVGVDMAELCRVFPRVKPDTAGHLTVRQSGHHQTDSPDTAALQAQVAMLERLLAAKDELIAQQRETMKLLTFQVEAEPAPQPSPKRHPTRPRSFLERIAAGIQTAIE